MRRRSFLGALGAAAAAVVSFPRFASVLPEQQAVPLKDLEGEVLKNVESTSTPRTIWCDLLEQDGTLLKTSLAPIEFAPAVDGTIRSNGSIDFGTLRRSLRAGEKLKWRLRDGDSPALFEGELPIYNDTLLHEGETLSFFPITISDDGLTDYAENEILDVMFPRS